jgi:predicted O-methyltransferase YrrM
VKQLIKAILGKLPYVNQLHEQIQQLREQIQTQGAYPSGHYYSPIPDKDEVIAYIDSRKPLNKSLPGVDLNEENQLELLHEYSQFYKELPFPEKQQQDCRYFYENDWYSYSDAIFLYSFLRKHKPKRIIEIGSGFSSAVMLDTIERFFSNRPEITFIEPYPDRLKSLLRNQDEDQVKIIEKKIQEVPLELFSSLESGDFLFIDSSHVVKCGSDLQLLLFEILPLLPDGVFVHFHDVFYPFDYPSDWLKEGRYWNENYFLRAFLSYNCEWNIYFFNTYMSFSFNDFIKDKMPLCTKNSGGSLYIQRKRKG